MRNYSRKRAVAFAIVCALLSDTAEVYRTVFEVDFVARRLIKCGGSANIVNNVLIIELNLS